MHQGVGLLLRQHLYPDKKQLNNSCMAEANQVADILFSRLTKYLIVDASRKKHKSALPTVSA